MKEIINIKFHSGGRLERHSLEECPKLSMIGQKYGPLLLITENRTDRSESMLVTHLYVAYPAIELLLSRTCARTQRGVTPPLI